MERLIAEEIDVNAVEVIGLADGEMRKGFANARLEEPWLTFFTTSTPPSAW